MYWNILLQFLWLSQWCIWSLCLPGVWHCVNEWFVPQSIWDSVVVSVSKIKWPMKKRLFLDIWPLNTRPPCSLRSQAPIISDVRPRPRRIKKSVLLNLTKTQSDPFLRFTQALSYLTESLKCFSEGHTEVCHAFSFQGLHCQFKLPHIT